MSESASSAAEQPLRNIVVADFATPRAELAGRLLGELGAVVVKVEPPEGAAARHLPPFANRTGESLYWESVAAGKQSVVADIREAAGREAIAGLLRRADILIESGDPGEMAALGLGYDAVKAINPGIVYVSVTPYGQSGPDAKTPATDLTLEAACGLLGLQGDRDRPPVPIGYPQASFQSGIQAAVDALIALRARGDSAEGQYLDLSMQATMISTLMNATGYPAVTGGDPPNTGETRATTPPGPVGILPAIWKCADGWITCSLAGGRVGSSPMQTVLTWAAADGKCDVDLLARDWTTWALEFMAGNLPLEELQRAIATAAAFFEGHTQHDLMRMGTEMALLLSPAFTVPGLLNDPQLAGREYWREVDGHLRPGVPVRMSRTPLREPQPAPALGANQDLLATFAPAAEDGPRRSGKPKRAFEGLKVADFAWVGVGPMVGKALADHGATVVRVESPARTDVLRTLPPFKDNLPGLDRAQFMANLNTSKMGLNLDLAKEAGREVAHKLLDWCDVALESFTAGSFARMGFDFAELSKKKPDLILFSTCLRGQTGPQRTYGGYGSQGAALAGIYAVTGWPDRAPASPFGAYTDFIAPRYGVAAFTSAIRYRDETGLGQHIDLSQVEAGIHFIEPLVLDYTVNGRVAGQAGHESATASPHGVYQCAGTERYIALACETAEHWRALRSVAPLDAFAGDHLDAFAARHVADDAIDDALAAWCAEQEPFPLVERLKTAGVPAAVVLRPLDLYEDAQIKSRGFFHIVDHPVMGPTPVDGPATLYSETPPVLRAAPLVGQHEREVLEGILGYSSDEIAALHARGAIVPMP